MPTPYSGDNFGIWILYPEHFEKGSGAQKISQAIVTKNKNRFGLGRSLSNERFGCKSYALKDGFGQRSSTNFWDGHGIPKRRFR
tara:strand:+ start:840 stop:1091 length:252 start_codon:yes stop_codon:yes gene_type:complete